MSAPQLPTPHLIFSFPPQGFGGGGAIIIAPMDIPAVLQSFRYDTATSSTDSLLLTSGYMLDTTTDTTDSTLVTAAPGLDVTTDTTDSILSTIFSGVET